MAGKTKLTKKTTSKSKTPAKKAAHKPAPARKSLVSNKKGNKQVKAVKPSAAKVPPRVQAKRPAVSIPKAPVRAAKSHPRVENRQAAKSRENPSRQAAVQKIHSREYSSAVHAYEAGLKLMHAEEYARAIKAFRELVGEHTDEPEILERARVLMHASEKKLQERARLVLRSADDHYNAGIGDLNRRQLETAVEHFQHGLKLAPKADHILYAIAAANALRGSRDEALSFLKLAIQHRAENRFMATRDADFESLMDDADFKSLVASPEK